MRPSQSVLTDPFTQASLSGLQLLTAISISKGISLTVNIKNDLSQEEGFLITTQNPEAKKEKTS